MKNSKIYLLVSSIAIIMSFFMGKEGCNPVETSTKIDSLLNTIDSIKLGKDTMYLTDTIVKIKWISKTVLKTKTVTDTIDGETIITEVPVFVSDSIPEKAYFYRNIGVGYIYDTLSFDKELKSFSLKDKIVIDSSKMILMPKINFVPAVVNLAEDPNGKNRLLVVPGYNLNYELKKSSYSIGVGVLLKNNLSIISSVNPQNKVIQTNVAIPLFKW